MMQSGFAADPATGTAAAAPASAAAAGSGNPAAAVPDAMQRPNGSALGTPDVSTNAASTTGTTLDASPPDPAAAAGNIAPAPGPMERPNDSTFGTPDVSPSSPYPGVAVPSTGTNRGQ
jgi:hypothetical protein